MPSKLNQIASWYDNLLKQPPAKQPSPDDDSVASPDSPAKKTAKSIRQATGGDDQEDDSK